MNCERTNERKRNAKSIGLYNFIAFVLRDPCVTPCVTQDMFDLHVIIISIGGFHVTRVSLIITKVKNKIVYHLLSQEIEISWKSNKQRAKVAGMCDVPNSRYSAKGFTEKYMV